MVEWQEGRREECSKIYAVAQVLVSFSDVAIINNNKRQKTMKLIQCSFILRDATRRDTLAITSDLKIYNDFQQK